MTKLSKKAKAVAEEVDVSQPVGLSDAVEMVKKGARSKFDESVDMAVKLGVDPRQADQMIRGTCALPHGTGKTVRVLAIAKGAKAAEAEKAGADIVGGEEIIEKIKEGWFEFDRIVATPDMMGQVGKVGKILGPRGVMPNPKSGTVSMDIGAAVASIKAGQVAFRVDKAGIIHVPVGRASFEPEKLAENITAVVDTIRKLKPGSAKGQYMKSMTVTSTMGPGIRIDLQSLA